MVHGTRQRGAAQDRAVAEPLDLEDTPALLAEAAAQPDRVLGLLFRRFGASVGRWAFRLGGPAVDIDDVVQEVFLIAHRRLSTFCGQSKIETWLYSITNNVVRHHRRRDRFRAKLHPLLQGFLSSTTPAARTPLDAAEEKSATALLYRVLDGMREKYRTVFILFEIEGLSGEEIATLTGLRVSAVRVRLFRAREQFRQRLRSHTKQVEDLAPRR